MNDLSIINENVVELRRKGLDESNEKSDDSGLASSDNSNSQSGSHNHYEVNGCLIIKFKALNANADGVRESTFVANSGQSRGSCNLSGIAASSGTQTINSDDGN